MAVVATCLALPVLVLLDLPAVQGWDHCFLTDETCPDVCCGLRWNATCCFQSNSTDWWTTDYPPYGYSDGGGTIGFLVGVSVAGLAGLAGVTCFCTLVCRACCCRRPEPAYVFTTSNGPGIPMVSPKEGYVFPGSLDPAAPRHVTQGGQTQGGNGPMSPCIV